VYVCLAVGVWLQQRKWTAKTWVQTVINFHCQCVHYLNVFV